MTTVAAYEIAETDELEALGRDDVAFDTSAGLGPDEPVQEAEFEQPSSSKPRFCIFLVVVVLALAAVAAFLGIFLSRKGDSKETNAPSVGSGQPTGGGSPSTSQPEQPESITTVAPPTTASNEVKSYAVKVLDKKPHDHMAFTQGFEYADGVFYESTGLRGKSSLRKVEIETGKVLQKYDFPDMTLFGEGMTLHTTHHIFMLTWQAGRGFIFNQSTFEVVKEWKYEGEGWGLCMDHKKDEVYMSDGTHELRVLDPEDLSEKRRVAVTLRGHKVKYLNELEWICGEVWANVWQTSRIYRIDPVTGKVKSIINASILPLAPDDKPSNDVLNGIAFDREHGRLWLTGKQWPVIYQVSVTDDSLDLTNCK